VAGHPLARLSILLGLRNWLKWGKSASC